MEYRSLWLMGRIISLLGWVYWEPQLPPGDSSSSVVLPLTKKIDPKNFKYSQFETYWGTFLTDFFSFFMIVATAATLYVHYTTLNRRMSKLI
jgi:Mn2+/Fe2+ NRAMP family transporter